MITDRCSEPNHGSQGKSKAGYNYSEPCPHMVQWKLPETGQLFCRYHRRYHPRRALMIPYDGYEAAV